MRSKYTETSVQKYFTSGSDACPTTAVSLPRVKLYSLSPLHKNAFIRKIHPQIIQCGWQDIKIQLLIITKKNQQEKLNWPQTLSLKTKPKQNHNLHRSFVIPRHIIHHPTKSSVLTPPPISQHTHTNTHTHIHTPPSPPLKLMSLPSLTQASTLCHNYYNKIFARRETSSTTNRLGTTWEQLSGLTQVYFCRFSIWAMKSSPSHVL